MPQQQQDKPKVRPVEFREGRAKILAWANPTPSGVRYGFSTVSLYPDRETGKLKEGSSFSSRDLPNLAKAVLKADQWFQEQLKQAATPGTEPATAAAAPATSKEPANDDVAESKQSATA